MLYQINDLRTAIETAKRVLTKEKLDKQKTGQSSSSPFMKASQENSKKNSKKGVSFGALETIDRHSDSIDKSASLVSKLDMKLDKWETQYRPQVYQARNRGYRQRQDSYRPREGHTVGTMVSTTTEEEEIIKIIIEITEIIVGLETETLMEMATEGMMGMIVDQTIGETMGLTIGKITEGIIIDKIKGTKGTEIEV